MTAHRSPLTRILGTVAGIALLYFVGAGPAAYLWNFSEKSHRILVVIYGPLYLKAVGTPFEDVLGRYQAWWSALGQEPSPAPLFSFRPGPP